MEKLKFTLFILAVMFISSCNLCHAQELTASWYSVASLKQEGTWSYSHGKMANGQKFKDNGFTCATRLYPLGTRLCVSSSVNHKQVCVIVTDRIGRRFATQRIDLSKEAFSKISKLNKGIIKVTVRKES